MFVKALELLVNTVLQTMGIHVLVQCPHQIAEPANCKTREKQKQSHDSSPNS